MPQELRYPEYRTDEAIEEVTKTLDALKIMNHPAIANASHPEQEMALFSSWPDMTEMDAEYYLAGKMLVHDIMIKKHEKPVPKDGKPEGKLVFEDEAWR